MCPYLLPLPVCLTPHCDQELAYILDTDGKTHTAEHLLKLVMDVLDKADREFPQTQVVGVVTDSASNMVSLRRSLRDSSTTALFTYGCQAHMLNLVVGDAMKEKGFDQVMQQITMVAKAFKNSHCLAAALRAFPAGRMLN